MGKLQYISTTEYYIVPYIIKIGLKNTTYIESKKQVVEGYVEYDIIYIVLKYIKLNVVYEYINM